MIDEQGRLLPDFLIVGAMRGGTNGLGHALAAHPEVSIAKGEIHFFDRDEQWRRGADHYATRFRLAGNQKVCGERTPAYSDPTRPGITPPIPERIAALLPDAKLIWSLRDPVERAWSHHWHEVDRGRSGDSFEDALVRQERSGERRHPLYLERGLYARQVRAFLEHFQPAQMHFILAESLFADRQETLRGVYRFLGVAPELPNAAACMDAADGADVVRNSSKRVSRLGFLDRLVGRSGRTRFSRRVQRANKWFASVDRPAMLPETRERLLDFYRPFDEDLAKLTGLDLGVWGTHSERNR